MYVTISDYTTLFKFEVVSKEYNAEHERGCIIKQEITREQTAPKGTTIKVVVSLGPRTVKIPASIIGKTYDEAVIELMKLGFDFNNIEKLEVYDPTKPSGVVIEVEPGTGKVDLDAGIILRVNSYTPPSDSDGTDTPQQ